ncbi:hypothetical protein [Pontibacter roseus]|uniref:hypothetical protein n=1 Tax=Pontibacter roseus TaxID=336989 RepID=UPI000376A638|nr:hypothetical protein [Pontibacter roseus]
MNGLIYMLALLVITSCKDKTASMEESALQAETTTIANSQMKPSEKLREARAIRNVEDIREEYAYITSVLESGRLDSASFSYNCNDEKKGTATYFSEKGQLRMVRHTYSEYSHFSAVDSYYVKEDALFFVFHNRLTWSFVHQGQTRDNVTENRVYIIDDEPVKCLQKKYTEYSRTNGAPQSEQVDNKEVDCSSLGFVQKDFQSLARYRKQREDLQCLEL